MLFKHSFLLSFNLNINKTVFLTLIYLYNKIITKILDYLLWDKLQYYVVEKNK